MRSYEFYINTEKKDIDFINKVIEAYEGIGVVRTLSAKDGKIKIITIDSYIDELKSIFKRLREYDVKLEIEKETYWEGVL